MDGPDAAPAPRAASRARIFAQLIGIILIIAAVVAVAKGQAGLASAFDAVRNAPLPLLALGAALPLASLALTSLSFHLLTSRYGQVGRAEMFALIGAAWLLNYLPLWPGLVGRFAYHKRFNAIPLQSSAVATIWANVLSAAACAILLVITALGALFFEGNDPGLTMLLGAPAPMFALAGIYARARPPAPDPHFWRLPMTLAVRMVEVQVWAARYAVCFALIGQPIAWGGAVAIAAITQLASIIAITGNALGIREWVTGLLAPLLPLGLTLTASINMHTGLTADLVNRAIEVALAVPVGIVCAAWVAQRALSRATDSRLL